MPELASWQVGKPVLTIPFTYLHTLLGQINRRKQPKSPQPVPNQSSGYHSRPSFPYGPRSTPYTRGRGQTFQNRSLMVSNRAKPVQTFSARSTSPPEEIEIPRAEYPNLMPRGIAKHGRGAKAWISEHALRHQLERQKYHLESLQATGEDLVINQSIASGSDTPTPSTAYIRVADIPFHVTNGGSKLLRMTGMRHTYTAGAGHAQILQTPRTSPSPHQKRQ